MARKKSESLNEAVSAELKAGFDLNKFKSKKGLTSNSKFKTQKWIPFSPAVKNALSISGIPMGHITLARGGSDTGKTTLLIETAVTAQKMGILPVFIITEQKWDFKHAKQMGLQLEEIPDIETGEIIDHKGFFIYVDRSSLNSIEDVAGFIADILDEQRRGNLPYDLLFLWDSSGSIPCKMSIDQNNNNPMWNAGAMATQFGNFINQKFPLSRKENYTYTNTFFVINKTGVQPALTFGSQPRMTNKGGNAMYWDSTVVVTFGNVTNSGTSKISVQHKGKKVEFAKRTKIAIDKIHTDYGIATASTIIVTPHGFIPDSPEAIKEYKKQYAHTWFNEQIDIADLTIMEDNSEWDESNRISPIIEVEREENTDF